MKLGKAFLRSIEWRILSALFDFVIVYLITGEIVLSGKIVGATTVAKTLILAGWISLRT